MSQGTPKSGPSGMESPDLLTAAVTNELSDIQVASDQTSPNLLSSSFFNSETFQNHALNLRKSIIFSPSMDSVQVTPVQEVSESSGLVATTTDSESVTSTSPLRLKKKLPLDRTIELKVTNSPSFQGLADILENKVKKYESSSNIKALSQFSPVSSAISPTSSKFTQNNNTSPTPSPLKKIPSLEIDTLLPPEDTPKVYQSAIIASSNSHLSQPPQLSNSLSVTQDSRSPNLIQLSDSPVILPPQQASIPSRIETDANSISTSNDIFGTPQVMHEQNFSMKNSDKYQNNEKKVDGFEVENVDTPVFSTQFRGSETATKSPVMKPKPIKKAPLPQISVLQRESFKQRSASLSVLPSKTQQPAAVPEPVKKKKGFMSFFKSTKRISSLQVPSSKSKSTIAAVNANTFTTPQKPTDKPLKQSKSFSVEKNVESSSTPPVAKRSTSSNSLFSAFKRKSKMLDSQSMSDLANIQTKFDSVSTKTFDSQSLQQQDQNSDNEDNEKEEFDEPKKRISSTSFNDEFNEDFNNLRISTPASQTTSRFAPGTSNSNHLLSPRSARSHSSMIDQGETLFPKSLNPQEVESIVSIERSRSFNRSIRSKRGSYVQRGNIINNTSFDGPLLTKDEEEEDGFAINFEDEYRSEFDHIIDQIQLNDNGQQEQLNNNKNDDGEDDYKQFIEFADIINFGSSDIDLGLNYETIQQSPSRNTDNSPVVNQKAMFNHTANYQESPIFDQHTKRFEEPDQQQQEQYQSSPLIPQNFDDDDNDSFHIHQTPNYEQYNYSKQYHDEEQGEQQPHDITYQQPHAPAQIQYSSSSFTSTNEEDFDNYEEDDVEGHYDSSPLTSPFLQQTSYTNYTPPHYDPTQPPKMARPISMSFRGLKSPAFNSPLSIPPPSLIFSTPSSVASSPRHGTTRRNVKFSNKLTIFETFHEEEYDRHPDLATCNELNPQLAIMIKNELNELKSEMEVHESSRCYTHFF